MKTSVNGVDLEFDIFEASNAEKYQKETQKIIETCEKLKGEQDFGKSIRGQCKAVFGFIDALFGEGKHNEIFGDSVNLKTCIKVYSEINAAIAKDRSLLEGAFKTNV